MLSFSTDPQDFIQEWLRSQRRDLKVQPSFLRLIPILLSRRLAQGWRPQFFLTFCRSSLM